MCRLCNSTTPTALLAGSVAPTRAPAGETSRGAAAAVLPAAAGAPGRRVLIKGGAVLSMDVSVLGDPTQATDVSKHDVAKAAGSSIQAAIDSGDENHAMQIMARGAAAKQGSRNQIFSHLERGFVGAGLGCVGGLAVRGRLLALRCRQPIGFSNRWGVLSRWQGIFKIGRASCRGRV